MIGLYWRTSVTVQTECFFLSYLISPLRAINEAAAGIWFALMLCRVRIKISAMIFEVEGRKMEKNWPIKTEYERRF